MLTVNGPQHQRRAGFTLVELLVVITIIGILMGLLIPAVQAAREAARRNQCSTQINNLAKAALQEEMAKRRFPGWIESFGFTAAQVDPGDPNQEPNHGPHRKLGSWAVTLLPYLDQQSVYEIWNEDKYPLVTLDGEFTERAAPNLPIMQCPSSPTTRGSRGKNSYISNNGMQPVQSAVSFGQSMRKANGVFNNKYAGASGVSVGEAVRLDDLVDGPGNIVLFSENLSALPWNRLTIGEGETAMLLSTAQGPGEEVDYNPTLVSSRYVHGMVWHFENDNQNVQNNSGCGPVTPLHRINGSLADMDKFNIEMSGNNMAGVARPSSAHSGGVNMGFASGATRFVVESIDYQVYQALMTTRGKSSNVPFREYVLPGDAF